MLLARFSRLRPTDVRWLTPASARACSVLYGPTNRSSWISKKNITQKVTRKTPTRNSRRNTNPLCLRLFALILPCLPLLFAGRFIRQTMYLSDFIEVFSILFESSASMLFLRNSAVSHWTVLLVHSIHSRREYGSRLPSIGERFHCPH